MVIRLVTYVVVTHPVSAESPSHAVFMWLEFMPVPNWLPPNAGFAPANARTEGVATTADTARAWTDRSATLRWMIGVMLFIGLSLLLGLLGLGVWGESLLARR